VLLGGTPHHSTAHHSAAHHQPPPTAKPTPKPTPADPTPPDRRGDIHVLLVGDPGLGKSQLLQSVASAAPRGLYICGNTSTGAGLTVSVVRDAVTGDSMFEAGAVVLGDRGVCCVDEFDKMGGEHQALLEAMEQQQVRSVAGGGGGSVLGGWFFGR